MSRSSVCPPPGRMGGIFASAMEEILGEAEMQRLLTQAGMDEVPPSQTILFDQIVRLQEAILGLYGVRPGRGICRRLGSAGFKYALREFDVELGLNASSFRLQPMQKRLRLGLESLARLFNAFVDERITLEQKEETICWRIENCPFCWGRQGRTKRSVKAEEPVCDWMVGFLQEALYWISGGKCFQVEEKECLANGGRMCTIGIDLCPLG